HRRRLARWAGLPAERLGDLRGRVAELATLLVVLGERDQDPDRVLLRRTVLQCDDGEPADGVVPVARDQLVQQRANGVDDTGMLAREALEREQRRAAARRALVLEPAAEELRLLPEAELPDR